MPQLFPATFNAVSAILAIGLASLIIYIYNRFSYWSRRGISGPNHYFPLLNWYGFTQKPVADTYIENFKKYGKIWGRYDGLHPILVISEKNLAQKILNDTITFPDRFELAAKRDIEDSLLPFVAGQRWKTLHSALTPCFTTGKMKILFQPMKQCADKAMDEIEKSANDNGKPFQIEFKRLFDRYTLDVAAKCFFAKDLNPYEDGEFVLNANKFAYILFWRMISYIALPNWLIKLLRVYIVPDDLFNYFKNLIVDLAIERKKSGKTGRDFLQLLLDSKLALIDPNQLPEGTKISKKDLERELTDNEMASSSVLFIIGGYDTSSLQLSWMCYRLALNPEVQERLYQEIMENDTDDYDVLLTMPYLNAVFMETLRMDTPVYCTMRMANKPWRLPDKVEIPKGATVEVPIQVIHMDPDYFPEPEVFDPDRFMPERRAEIPSNAFYGFGSGPRICIGMRFALLDVKIAIVELLKRYELLSTIKNPECGKFSHVRRPIRMDITLKRRTD